MKNDNPNRILIIDDNEAIHRDFRKILESQEENAELRSLEEDFFGEPLKENKECLNCEIISATQGLEGVEILRKELEAGRSFQMAFVDMRMPPGLDGVETIEKLWEIDPTLQVVICTAYSDRSWEEISQRLEHPERLLILKKPFDEVEVLQMAESLCQKWKANHASAVHLQKLEGDLQQQHDALQAVTADAEQLIQAIQVILISLNSGRQITRWNTAATNTFGIDAETAIGQKLTDLNIQWEDTNRISAFFEQPQNETTEDLQLCFVDNTGCNRTLEARVSEVLHDDTCGGWLFLATDTTEKIILQSQLDQAQRLESVGQLAAGVAHEINTPMQYIGDSVRFVKKSLKKMEPLLDSLPQLLVEDADEQEILEIHQNVKGVMKPKQLKFAIDDIAEALDDALQGVGNVSTIVAAMKEFSHPGSDEKTPVSLNHILQSTITVAKNEWKYVADVHTDFAPDLENVPGYAGELNQVFLNILVNASHAISDRVANGDYEKGRIDVSTRNKDKNQIEITIRDNGGGIPEKVRHRVFEPFFTTKVVGKGTGQGLAIAHNVISQKHQGSIWCEVEEGDSTTFFVHLPIVDPDTESVSAIGCDDILVQTN